MPNQHTHYTHNPERRGLPSPTIGQVARQEWNDLSPTARRRAKIGALAVGVLAAAGITGLTMHQYSHVEDHPPAEQDGSNPADSVGNQPPVSTPSHEG